MFDMLFKISEHEEERLKAKSSYLILLYFVCLFAIAFYVYRYVSIHNIIHYNIVHYANLFVIAVIVPFVYWLTRKVYFTGIIFYISSILEGVFLILLAGGFKAPGVFWISIIPFLGVVAFGRKGVIVGIVMTVATLVLFSFVDSHGVLIKMFEENRQIFYFEKKLNLYLYTLTMIIASFYHVIISEKYQDKLKEDKEENDNLLRILYHDMANPIQILKFQIKKINSKMTKEDIPPEFLKMEQTIHKISDQLENVKKMKSLRDGKKKMELIEVSLNFAFMKTKESLEDSLNGKKMNLLINSGNELDQIIYADLVPLIYQVFSNIISNAIKFSKENGIIEVSWRKEGKSIIVDIRDHGIGMPNNILCKIFSNNSPTTRMGTNGEVGTGYGMPIVKSYVELFQAKITIKSVEESVSATDHGTTVTFVFPANVKHT